MEEIERFKELTDLDYGKALMALHEKDENLFLLISKIIYDLKIIKETLVLNEMLQKTWESE